MSDKKTYPQATYEELEEMARRTDNAMFNPIMQPIEPVDIETPGADTRQVKRNVADAIFGTPEASQNARAQRDSAFQTMLNARKQAVEQQRTSDVALAKYNALGNLLTTLVQPVGWAIGGGRGATGGVQPYDNRQYLAAFNRALKANDDLRNIGTSEAEYKFKLANEDYARALHLEDEARQRRQRQEDLDLQAKRQAEYAQQRHDFTMDEIEARGDAQKELAEIKNRYRVTRGGLSVDDRALITARNNYEQYKRRKVEAGEPYMDFKQYMNDYEGLEVEDNNATATATTTQKTAQKPAGAEKKGGFQPWTNAVTNTTAATKTKTEKKGGFQR